MVMSKDSGKADESGMDRPVENERASDSDSPETGDPVQPGSPQGNKDDGGDANRPNNLVLGAGYPAEVRYPHQVGGTIDERGITPENPTDERTERPPPGEVQADDMRKSAKPGADTRATETPGEKR